MTIHVLRLTAFSVALMQCIGCMSLHTDIQPLSFDQPDPLLDVLTNRLKTDSWKKNQEHNLLALRNPKADFLDANSTRRWIFVDDQVIEALSEMNIDSSAKQSSVEESKNKQPDNEASAEKIAENQATADYAGEMESESDSNETAPSEAAQVSNQEHSTDHQKSSEKQANSWDGFFPLQTSDLLERMQQSRTNSSEKHRGESNRSTLAKLARQKNLVGWNAAILWAQSDPAHAIATATVLENIVTSPPQYHPETGNAVDPLDETANAAPASTNQSNAPWKKVRDLTEDLFSKNDNKPRKDNTAPNSAKKTDPLKKDSESTEAELATVSRSMQAAAAESWCQVLAESSVDHLQSLTPVGKLLEQPNLQIEVRAELFRSLARWIAPDLIPRLANALQQSDEGERAPVEIRRAAIDACLIYAMSNHPVDASEASLDESIWPTTVWNCRWDPDAHVRRTFGRWLAVIKHPHAMETFNAQLRDTEVRVRESALISLGILRTDAAKEKLLMQSERPEIRIRQFTVKGLAYWGLVTIAPFAKDRSHDVRQAVAEQLAQFPEAEAALLQRDLLTDNNLQVQAKVIHAISDWPDQLAIPLLLHGLRDTSRANRELCFVRLSSRTGIQYRFPFDAPRQQRAQAVMEIVKSNDLPFGFFEKLQERQAQFSSVPHQKTIDEIRSMLDRLTSNPQHSPAFNEAREQLLQRNSEDVPIIEHYFTNHPAVSSTLILHDILPQLNPIYSSLVDLESSDVQIRRRAAGSLAKRGESTSLSPFFVKQLEAKLTTEQDRLVWQYAMSAVMQDGSDENAKIALLAVNNTWPDVRKLGCQYIGRHENPQQALWLVPLFFDADSSVQLAAIEAAGQCHNPLVIDGIGSNDPAEPVRGLRSLLLNPDQRLRFAVVIAMSKLGDSQGMQEMIRLGYHPEATIREKVVHSMGETGQSRFVEHLLRLAWTETNDLVKRAILHSLDLLVPAAEHPNGLAEISNYDDKIELWVGWWKQKHPTATVLSK